MATCTNIKIYSNGVWKDVKDIKMYANGAWQNGSKIRVFYNGTWYEAFTSILNVTPTTATVDYGGRVIVNDNGNYDLSITVSSNETWTVSKNFDWVNIMDVDYGNSTNQILLSEFHTNPSTSPRTGIVTISTPSGNSKTVTITQEGNQITTPPANYFDVDTTYMYFDSAGFSLGLDYFTISTNTTWSIQSKPTWIGLSPSSGGAGNVSVSCGINKLPSIRTGIIILVASNGITRQIYVEQDEQFV